LGSLAKQGYTQEVIATQLGVSQATISGDLGNLSTPDKLKPAKTATNPKGAGRPKGSGGGPRKKQPTPHLDKVQDVVDELVKAGKPVSRTALAKEYGVGVHTIQIADLKARAKMPRKTPPARPLARGKAP
jgi:hypothetical protein